MSAESPAVIIYDEDGNPVSVVLDGSIYRLQVEAKLTTGTLASPIRIDPTGTTAQPVTGSGTFSVKEVRAATPTQSSVAASTSNVTLLSANSNRLGGTIYNDSTVANLFIKLGATSSSTSFTARLTPSGYYEIPFGYTGIIDGFWSAASGSARVTEFQ